MKKSFYLSVVFLFLVVISQSVQGQSAEQEREAIEQQTREHIKKSNTSLPTTGTIPPHSIANSAISQAELKRQKEFLKKAQTELNILRAPHPDDLNKYNDFLKQKATGLLKLFPDLHCDSKLVVKVDGNCANAVQDSYSYSFRRKDYSDGVFHDIRFDEEKLWVDGFLSQAIITEIGDITLENVSLQSNYAQFLLNFKLASKSIEAKQQFWQIGKKVTENGFIYGKVVKPVVNTTYLARIVNYRLGDSDLLRLKIRELDNREQKPFLFLSFDKKRSDIILAFRIIRIDSDNSITILWKQLTENKSPELKFAKNEKWTDLKVK